MQTTHSQWELDRHTRRQISMTSARNCRYSKCKRYFLNFSTFNYPSSYMPKIDIRQCLEFTFFLVSPSKIIRQIQNVATSKLIITFHVPQSHFQKRSNCDELVSHLCSNFRVTRIVNKLSQQRQHSLNKFGVHGWTNQS